MYLEQKKKERKFEKTTVDIVYYLCWRQLGTQMAWTQDIGF